MSTTRSSRYPTDRGAGPGRWSRCRSAILTGAGGLVLAMTACTSAPPVTQQDTAPTLPPTAHDYHQTADGSERVTSLPVLRSTADAGKRVVFSEEVDLDAGRVLLAVAELQTTNDLGINVFVGSQVILATSPSATAGREITAANGGNVTPDMHHGQQTKSGTYQTTAGDTGTRYVNLVVWAAAGRSGTGQQLSVDRGYGRLSVLIW